MTDIPSLATALAPAFAVGLGIQHLNELLDPLFSLCAPNSNVKKLLMGLSSLFFGGVATRLLQLHIVQLLKGDSSSTWAFQVMDGIVSALIISTGTEGINSIIKFLGYAKDQKKAAAGQSESTAGVQALQTVNREP